MIISSILVHCLAYSYKLSRNLSPVVFGSFDLAKARVYSLDSLPESILIS